MSELINKLDATTIPVMPKEYRKYQTMNLDDAYEQGWNDMQRCIEELPSAKPEPHWILISEKLPDIKEGYCSETCLAYTDTGAYCFTYLEANIFGQVGWNCERDDDYHVPIGEVLAWMPLPEPYKAGE